jgi:hypothetical protein
MESSSFVTMVCVLRHISLKGDGVGNFLPVFVAEHHPMKAYWESGGIVPRILDLGTRWS